MSADPPPREALSRAQYAAIAAFRYQLRRFLAFSEAAAQQAGLPHQQHQALLAIAGHVGAEPPTVGLLAERLLIAPHTAAELVSRMVEASLLTKTRSPQDGRRMELALTPRAEVILAALTVAHLEELQTMEPALVRALGGLDRTSRDG
ncbi:MarR family transcriptional regulator [Methylobacterium sp. Leaf125]|jgi:DNA-binding MarR family transcriptional regulator|uniref:MarR family winged helix-turn-helix transcriptional regulator n=1 Tax=unclassified Methylobacterium TaxID=2615210 RepID=UPI0006F53231|nr:MULTISPECIES: MarR family winged helix-turn-helix transcriptional regulator [unclassified Methylobacterium]KQQ26079.1 MarR family transcriptional regulator [Methylobacterium sp. Leaf125]POR41196.1 MarR family transcriptional regulator [Methylobacterium sp. V23]